MSPAHRPDRRPYRSLSFLRAFSVSCGLWRFAAVVCGGRVLLFDRQTGAGGLREGTLAISMPKHCVVTVAEIEIVPLCMCE